jgi:hypothetical protein
MAASWRLAGVCGGASAILAGVLFSSSSSAAAEPPPQQQSYDADAIARRFGFAPGRKARVHETFPSDDARAAWRSKYLDLVRDKGLKSSAAVLRRTDRDQCSYSLRPRTWEQLDVEHVIEGQMDGYAIVSCPAAHACGLRSRGGGGGEPKRARPRPGAGAGGAGDKAFWDCRADSGCVQGYWLSRSKGAGR